MQRRAIAVLATVAAVFMAVRAEAGIVVRDDGTVFIGNLKDDPAGKGVYVRWPYGDQTVAGRMLIQKKELRWVDEDHDTLTREYWKKFPYPKFHLKDPRWLATRPVEGPKPPPPPEGKGGPRAYQRVAIEELSLLKPEGWTIERKDGVLALVSDTPGTDGVRARIHVYSLPDLELAPEGHAELFRRSLRETLPGRDAYEVREEAGPRAVRGGYDYELATVVRRPGAAPIVSHRKVFMRAGKLYVFCVYTHERDFEGRLALFMEQIKNSVQISER